MLNTGGWEAQRLAHHQGRGTAFGIAPQVRKSLRQALMQIIHYNGHLFK